MPAFRARPLLLRRRFALYTDEEVAVAEGRAMWGRGWRGVRVAWPDGSEVHISDRTPVTYSPVLFVFAAEAWQHELAVISMACFPGFRAQCWGCHTFTFATLTDARRAERVQRGSVRLGAAQFTIYLSRT